MPKAKIASVGCGWVAKRWHLPTIAELAKRGDLEFVAVCDIDENTAVDASIWHQDFDSDGFGNASVSLTQCYQPTGYG